MKHEKCLHLAVRKLFLHSIAPFRCQSSFSVKVSSSGFKGFAQPEQKMCKHLYPGLKTLLT